MVALALFAVLVDPAGADPAKRVNLDVTNLAVVLPSGWDIYSVRAAPNGKADDAYDVIAQRGSKLLVEVRFVTVKSCAEWRTRYIPEGATAVKDAAYWPPAGEDWPMFEIQTDTGTIATGCTPTTKGVLEATIVSDDAPGKHAPLLLKLTTAVIDAANLLQVTDSSVAAQPHTEPFSLEEATRGLKGGKPLTAVIATSRGKLVCTLDDKRAPIAVANFVGLARGLRPFHDPRAGWVTRRFYDGLTIHRVVPGFVIQGGDLAGNGTGKVGYTIKNEDGNGLVFDRAGRLATARDSDPDSAGGQFFITDAPQPHLSGHQTIFGECGPIATIHAIASVPHQPDDRPRTPITIDSVTITR